MAGFAEQMLAQFSGDDGGADPAPDAGGDDLDFGFDAPAGDDGAAEAGEREAPAGEPGPEALPPAPTAPPVDPQAAFQQEAYRQLQELQRTNPVAAAEIMRQQAAYLDSIHQAQAPQQPQLPDFLNFEPVTEGERAMKEFALQSLQRQQEYDRMLQSQRELAARESVDRTFAELETQFKREIPIEQRQKVAELCLKTGCQDLGVAYKAVWFEQAQQAAMEKGQRIARQKQAPAGAPPAGRVARPSQTGGEAPKGIHAHFDAVWNKMNGD